MKAIFILGAGVMQGPAIQIAKEKGFKVYVADGNAKAINVPMADVFYEIDLKDVKALTEQAKKIPELKAVFTAGTDFSSSVAYVANHLGLPGIPYETAIDCSDKARMRKKLKENNVPVPPYIFGDKNDDPEKLFLEIAKFPVVIKPVDNMGGRACRLARNIKELKEAYIEACASSRTSRAIIEGYMDGPEFSLDAVVQDGQIILRGFADRIVTFEPFFVEMGHTMPSIYGKEIKDEVLKVFKDGVKALGITCGAAKGDMKYTREGAFVGEIAARLSGGYMSGWTYPYSSGISAISEAIDIASGKHIDFDIIKESQNLFCAERAWISIPGIVSSVTYPEQKNSNIKDVFPRAEPGSKVVFPENNVEKCGNVISVSETEIEASKISEEYARNVIIRLKTKNSDTDDFLARKGTIRTSDGTVWPKDAFHSISAMLKASLDSMPPILKNNKDPKTVSIAALREYEKENCTDWHDRTISQCVDIITKMTDVKIGMEGDIVLGRVFWDALIRGSYQAGLYVVDTYLG